MTRARVATLTALLLCGLVGLARAGELQHLTGYGVSVAGPSGAILSLVPQSVVATLPGARVGASCSVGAPSGTVAGITGACLVTANDTVRLDVLNVTAGSLTAPSGSWTIRVFNP